jgi:Rieske Fe-S protein
MSDTNASISRRQFCQLASGATVAALVAGCSKGSPSSPSSSSGGGSSAPVLLGVVSGQFAGSSVQVQTAGTALADVGGAALVQSVAGVFLVSRTSASAFSAVEAVCTHEGCTVNGTDGSIYVCPCHGSRYDRNGKVVGGPATASLRQYPNSFANGVVTIAV